MRKKMKKKPYGSMYFHEKSFSGITAKDKVGTTFSFSLCAVSL